MTQTYLSVSAGRRRSGRRSTRLSLHTLEARDLPAAFTAGDVVIYRVGDGVGSLANTGNAVFLDEYSPSGTLVQSIALPTTASGSNHQLIASGTATSEGLMTRSTDGAYLAVTGYGRDLGGSGSVVTTAAATVPRIVGLIGYNGSVDTSTALTDFADASNPRGVVSTNGTDLWVDGAVGGIRYTTKGSTTSTQLSTTVVNLRQPQIFDGQLYVSDSSGTTVRLGTVGTGLPTTSGQTITNLPGFPANTGSPYAFYLADLTASVAGVDTLYVADDGIGIAKYSLVSGIWTSNGTVGTAADAFRGLTASVSGSTVTLFAVRKGGSSATGGGELVTLQDTSGYDATLTGTPTLLATAGTNTAYRGVAFAPFHTNQAPVNTVPGSAISAVEDTPTVLTGFSVTDADAGTANIKVTFSVPSGTLTVATGVAGGVTAAQVSGNGTTSVVLTAPQAAINATLADSAGLTYSPAANAFGDITLTMLSDDQGNSGNVGGAQTDSDSVTISVAPVADTPSVTDATTDEDTQTTSGLVVDRNPVDGSEVSHFKVTAISNGTLYQHDGTTPIASGDFITYSQANAGLRFMPAPNFNGTGSFQVQASTSASDSGLGGAVRTATITVNAVNDAPVNTLPAGFSTDEDNSIVLTGISAADVDAGSADVTVTLTVPAGAGTLRVATAVAGGVTDAQVAGNNSSAVTMTAPLAAINVTLADAVGLVYFPTANVNGNFDLSMVTNDQGNSGAGGALTDTDHATIAVAAVNDPPQPSVPGDQTTAEDTPLVFSLGTGNLVTVSDPDAGSGLKVVLTASNGTVALSGTAGLTVTGDGTAVVTAVGTVADLNVALAGLMFTPDLNYNGSAGLRVLADDQANTGSGGPLSNFVDVHIDVTPVNDPPVNVGPIPPNVLPVTEDTPFALAGDFGFVIDDPDAGTGDLSTTLTATHGAISVTDVPGVTISGNGTTTITATGPLDELNMALAGLTFTPEANYFGPAAIDVVTTDNGNTGGPAETDTDTFNIDVAPVNDAPVLGDYTFFLSGAITVGTVVGTVTATDIEGDAITYSITAGDPDGHFAIDLATGQITIADPVGLGSDYMLTATATDNGTPNLSDTGTVHVNRNTAPTGSIPDRQVNEDASPITVQLPDDFADAEQSAASLAYSLTGNTNAGMFQSVVLQGTDLILTPKADANGASSLTVRATDDGGLFTESTFTFTVNPVNDAPTLDPITDLVIAEDAGEQTVNLTGLSAGPADEVGQTMTVTATSSNQVLFTDPTVTYSGGSTGTLKFTPLPDANGPATVTVTVTDNGGTAAGGVNSFTRTFLVTVGAVEDRPVIDTTFTPLLPTIKLPIPKGTTPGGALVTDLVTHVTDPDAGDPHGIAITRVDTAAGTWQFFDGSQWHTITGVSDTTPLLLPADAVTKVRLLPGTKFRNKYASLSYRAWDQTTGTPDQVNTVDPNTDMAVSLLRERAWVAVGKPKPVVNTAGQPNLTPVRPLKEDHTSAAFTVKGFLTFLGLEAKEAEPTVKAFGIALSGDMGGTWQFNTGKGGWKPVPAVSDGAALLLRPTDRLRLVPPANYNGPATITYHTWDQKTGTFGTQADTAGAGFSAATETAVLTIAPVNDAPVVTSPPTLGTLAAGQATAAQSVANFLLGHATDVDSTGLGILFFPASAKVGAWQYQDSQGNWVTVTKATLLGPDVFIRFQAAATAKAGTYSLAFKVWDQTGKAGTALSKLAIATFTVS
jgi:hypothetical protein